jgi:hypothetical protein
MTLWDVPLACSVYSTAALPCGRTSLPVGIDCGAAAKAALARRRRGEDRFNMVGTDRRVNGKVYTNRRRGRAAATAEALLRLC